MPRRKEISPPQETHRHQVWQGGSEGGAGAKAAKGKDGTSEAEEAPGGERAEDEEEGGDKERAATSKQKFLLLVLL